MKHRASEAVDKYGEQIGDAAEKAGELIDERTGGKHSAAIDSGVEKVKDALDGLDGRNDDIDDQDQPPAPEPQDTDPAPPR